MALSLITRLAAFVGFGMLLAGCCANNVCDCPNEAQADAIRIVFDSTKYQIRSELDTLVLVRSLRPDRKKQSALLPKPETAILIRPAKQAYAPIIISNTAPFSQFGSARLDTFTYTVRYYPESNQKLRPSKRALKVDSVRLSGSFEGNGCCTCYANSRKLAFFKDTLTGPSRINLKDKPAIIITRP